MFLLSADYRGQLLLRLRKSSFFLCEREHYEISYNSCKNSFLISLMIEIHLLDTCYDTY